MPPNNTCPKCGSTWIKSNDLSGITLVKKVGEQYNIEMGKFIPVRVYVCSNCGYIELYKETE
jgi:predicted nucleic-acid-binding Zn-ribbon protein